MAKKSGSLDELFAGLEMEFKKEKPEQKTEGETTPQITTTTTQTQLSVEEKSKTQPTQGTTTSVVGLGQEQVETKPTEGSITPIEPPEKPTPTVEETPKVEKVEQQVQITATPQNQTQTLPPKTVSQESVALPAPKQEEKKPGDALASLFEENSSTIVEGVTPQELVYEAEPPETKEVWLIAGEKDDGKSHAAFSFIKRPGTNLIVAIAFDTKTARVWWNAYNGDPRIIVIPAYQWFTYKGRDEITKAAAETYRKLILFLETLKTGVTVRIPMKREDGSYEMKETVVREPDWIIIDNTEVFMRICEFTARYHWKLPPFAGAEWKLWDERNYYIRELFFKAFEAAKRGVIYTTYVKTDDVLIEDGRVVRRKESPKWVEAIKYETDYVIRVRKDSAGRRFYAEVIGSKDDEMVPCGETYDITDIGLWPAIEQKRFKTT